VKTWWPNGYGDAVLYLATISYDSTSGDLDQKSIHVGFRTVELVQDEVSSGELFFFHLSACLFFFVFCDCSACLEVRYLEQQNEGDVKF
jgi:hypothetical protein